MSREQPGPPPELGDLLRGYRLARGLSQEELGELSGLSARAIANMERGRTTRPYRSSVRALADALGLPPAQRAQLDKASRTVPAAMAQAADLASQSAGARLAGADPADRGTPRQLPAAVPQFTGRDAELAALNTALEQAGRDAEAPVVVAISGTAGVGKTGLAVHWAHRVAGQFPDGQIFADLRGYDPEQPVSAASALAAILAALGVPGRDIPADTGERAARYRTLIAGRRVLVLLDNASDPEQVRPLLPGDPGCLTIVTSRHDLAGLVATHGARRVELDLLPAEHAVGLLRLLVSERAAAEPDACAILAERCCRLPLALRVAAERAAAQPDRPLSDLADELSDEQRRLDVLDAGDARAAVRAVFSWSCRHLSAGAARAFRLLGLHPGPDFDRYAVAALAGTDRNEAARFLDQLARAHLVQQGGAGRYGMHDLLRAYARDLTASDERASDAITGDGERRAAHARLFGYYLHATANAMDAMFPAEAPSRPPLRESGCPVPPLPGPDAARAWLDAERANLVAVATRLPGDDLAGLIAQLAATVDRYLRAGGYFADAITVQARARQAAAAAGDCAAEAGALRSLGAIEFQQGRYEQARLLMRDALALARQAGSQYAEARTLHDLSLIDLQVGRRNRTATRHLRRSLALFRDLGDLAFQARALRNLALVGIRVGQYAAAARDLSEALEISERTGDRPGQAYALAHLGLIDLRRGQYPHAGSHLRQALALCRAIGDRNGEADVLRSLGVLRLSTGAPREAEAQLERALALYRQTGDRRGEAWGLSGLGLVELRRDRPDRAAGYFEQALAMSRQSGNESGQAEALNGLGEALLAAGRPQDARVRHLAALSLADRTGELDETARAHQGLASAHSADGQLLWAQRHQRAALNTYVSLDVPEDARPRPGVDLPVLSEAGG
jgi:tetratricopeptide (TPR) repeat protein/transcriptional regulator with XRE-family HTH domain